MFTVMSFIIILVFIEGFSLSQHGTTQWVMTIFGTSETGHEVSVNVNDFVLGNIMGGVVSGC